MVVGQFLELPTHNNSEHRDIPVGTPQRETRRIAGMEKLLSLTMLARGARDVAVRKLAANVFVQHGGNVAFTKIRDDGHNGLALVFGASS